MNSNNNKNKIKRKVKRKKDLKIDKNDNVSKNINDILALLNNENEKQQQNKTCRKEN